MRRIKSRAEDHAGDPSAARSHMTSIMACVQAASCYALQITASPAGFDSMKHQLTAAEAATDAVYASLHRCFHGILFPDTSQVANVTYDVDPSDAASPGERVGQVCALCGTATTQPAQM